MSDKKISQLDSLNVASANAVDTLPIVSAGETKKVTLDNLKLILTDLGFEFDELVFVSQNEVSDTPNSIVVSDDKIYFNDGSGNTIEMLLAGSTIQANKVVLTNQTATTGHDPKTIFIKDNALYWTDNNGVAHLIVAENQSPSFNSIKLSNQSNLTGHSPNSILVQDDKLYLVNSSQDALKVILEDSAAKLDKISLNNQASFSGHDSNSIIVKDEEVFYINEANEPSKLLQENSVAVLDKLILTGQTQLTGHATNSIILKDGKIYLVDNQQVAHEIGKPITVTDLGLENVDNTSDANKPVSTLQATAISDAEASAKSYADGLVVGLLNDRGSYDASSNTFPTTGGSGTSGAIKKGDLFFISVAGTLGGSDVTVGDSVRALANAPGQTASKWSIIETNIGYVPEPSIAAGTTAQYFRGDKTFQPLDKSAVGLGNVDNTSDVNKPLSTAQQTALNLKQDTSGKDANGGYAGLTLFKINFKNVLNTFTSFFTNSNTASRAYTFQDRDGIIADDTDLGLKSNIDNPIFTTKITTPSIIVSDETSSTIASFDASKNIKSLNTSTYPTLTELSRVKGVSSPIQTQLNNLAPATRVLTINGSSYDLSADRSWTISTGSIGGKIGIADSSGVYTYYTSLSAAMSASTSGNTIVLFTNITETLQIIWKDGVNLNGLGNTITSSYAGDCIIDNGVQVSATWMNVQIIGTSISTSQAVVNFTNQNTSLNGNKSTYIKSNVTGAYAYKSLGYTKGIITLKGIVKINNGNNIERFLVEECKFNFSNTGEYLYVLGAPIVDKIIVYSTCTTDYAVQGQFTFTNSLVVATGYGASSISHSHVKNCVIQSSAGIADNSTSAVFENCSILSTASYGTNSGSIFINCTIQSTANNAVRGNGQTLKKCTIISTVAPCIGNYNAPIYAKSTIFTCSWNNTGGHCSLGVVAGSIFSDCIFEVANSSTYVIYNNYLTPAITFIDNEIVGTSNILYACTNSQINTKDNYGNIIIG